MTPAESARENAISFECKKDALQQRQSGDWKISFTVQGIDMDERITRAPMGTRFVAVLVAINDDEMPITLAAKERKTKPSDKTAATPSLAKDKSSEKAKRDWRDMKPSAQAAIRCGEPIFWAYLNENEKYRYRYRVTTKEDAAEAVRDICSVTSRKHLDDDIYHAHRVLWHQLDSGYLAWKALEHA